MKKAVTCWQIGFFFIAFMPITKFFILPSIVAKYTGEDMWIATLFNMIFDFITLFVLMLLCYKTDKDIYTIFEECYGKIVTRVLLSLYVIYFLMKTISPFFEQKDYVLYTLYIANTNPVFFMPIFLIPFYLSLKKMRTIGRCATAVWALTLMSFLLIFLLSFLNINLYYVLPIGANSFSTIFKASYASSSWFGDCVYFMFFLGNIKREKKPFFKILSGYLIGVVVVLIFMITFWCSFTHIAFRQRFALTELSKFATIVNNIGRFDYIAIFLILFSDTIAISLPIYFGTQILCHIFGTQKKWIFSLLLTGIVFSVVMFLSIFSYTFETFITEVGGLFFYTFSNIIPIVTAIIFSIKRRLTKNAIQNS